MLAVVSCWQVYLYEQLPNYTFFPQPLPLPAARDYTAADFDGDGDVDIMISIPNSDSLLYFERRSNMQLEQLFDTDNPFNGVTYPHEDVYFDTAPVNWARATLGDWNGDGDADLVMVDMARVSLWTNQQMGTFVEVIGSKNPFAQLGFSTETTVSLVNVTGLSLDLVAPRVFTFVGPARRNGSYGYFHQQLSGELVEQHGANNPFDALDFADFQTALHSVGKSLVVDFDGDGDLDIISGELAYRRNDAGRFKEVSPRDSTYPFRGITDNPHSHWTFVDFDHDGDLDFVQAFMPLQSVGLRRWAVGIILEMKQNGTHQAQIDAWMQEVMGARMRFYRQDGRPSNITWTELTGLENPFYDIGGLGLDFACPAMVDLDGDGDWELVVATKNSGVFTCIETFSIVLLVLCTAFLNH